MYFFVHLWASFFQRVVSTLASSRWPQRRNPFSPFTLVHSAKCDPPLLHTVHGRPTNGFTARTEPSFVIIIIFFFSFPAPLRTVFLSSSLFLIEGGDRGREASRVVKLGKDYFFCSIEAKIEGEEEEEKKRHRKNGSFVVRNTRKTTSVEPTEEPTATAAVSVGPLKNIFVETASYIRFPSFSPRK